MFGQLLLIASTMLVANRDHVHAAHAFIVLFDDFLIIPGSFGSLVTGLWLAVRTPWGFARHHWVVVKWAGTLAAVLFGAAVIGGRIHHAFPAILADSIHPWRNPAYAQNRQILFAGIAVCIGIYAFLVVISYLKPWGRTRAKP